MREYYREPEAPVNPQSDPKTDTKVDPKESLAKFARSVAALSDKEYGLMIANFAWCAGQFMGSSDEAALIMGMVEFAGRFQDEALGEASNAIGELSGVPITIAIPTRSSLAEERLDKSATLGYEEGFLVGLTGVDYGGEGYRRERVIRGLAVVTDRKGREAFVSVTLPTSLKTPVLRPSEFQPHDPNTQRVMEELYPPKPTSHK